MRAIVFDKTISFRKEERVPEPENDEALVRIICAGICNTDIEIIHGYMGFTGIPGHEFTGIVEKCKNRDLIGRRVTGEINIGCKKCIFCRKGLKTHCPERLVLGIFKKNGAFAEFVTSPVENLHVLPDSVSDEEGVFVEPLAAAFQITEQVHIRPASKVCVMGEGKLGNLVAQVLGNTGCDLTVIGKYHKKLELLRQKGIKTALSSTEDQERIFDVVVDCTGSSKGIQTALKAVRPGGTLIQKTTVGGKSEIELNELVIHEITVQGSRCGPFGPAIRALSERLVDVKCMISDVFKLSDGVRAFRRATESGVMKVLLQP